MTEPKHHRLLTNNARAAICACGWHTRHESPEAATRAAEVHIDEMSNPARFALTDYGMRVHPRGFEHRSAGLMWSAGRLVHSRCTCGWRSAALRSVENAEAMLKVHIDKPRNAAGVIDNPDLPKLLRALASGADAQANSTHHILNAAAEELEAWRALEGARRIGGQVVG